MASIVTAVFKATIGFLVNKARNVAAEKLKEGDVTDRAIRDLIVREIDDVKSKLDGLARKDLLAAVDFFEEGLVLLYDMMDAMSTVSSNVDGKAVTLTRAMRNLDLTNMDESATTMLCNAKKRFEDARRKATEAFNNEALKTSDRVQAMGYRVVATVLETVDNPSTSLSACRLCIERLHSLPAVQNSFSVELKKGLRGKFSKDERREIISSVCRVNRILYDVALAVRGFGDSEVSNWPCLDIGDEKVHPLFDARVVKTLRKVNMEHCCVRQSFGQEGTEEQKLQEPRGIATNSNGQFIVADYKDRNVKVFDSSGTFLHSIWPPNDDLATELHLCDVATDCKTDDICVLATTKKPGTENYEHVVYVFDINTNELHHKFSLTEGPWAWTLSRVLDWRLIDYNNNNNTKKRKQKNINNKLLVMGRLQGGNAAVNMYEMDGQFVRRFGEGILMNARALTATNDGRVMVLDGGDFCVHVFSENGDHLIKFKVEESFYYPEIVFHRASQHVVVAGKEKGKDRIHVLIYTKDGEFVRRMQVDEDGVDFVRGLNVTPEGRIAVALGVQGKGKILVM